LENLLIGNENNSQLSGQKPKTKKRKKVILWISGIVIVLALAWGLAYGVSYIMGMFGKSLGSGSPFAKLLPGVNTNNKLNGEDQDRVNILLLGIGGAGHEGPNLTDTIIILSIKPSTNQISLLNIPRDLYVKEPGTNTYTKINALYQYGMDKSGIKKPSPDQQFQSGSAYLEQSITQVTGLQINYCAKMDFVGFTSIVDKLGGIDVYVEKDLYDPYYPTNDGGYQTFKISKGQTHMDGALALKYARSRETTSDFDRSRRQQLVMEAIKEKAMSLSIFDVTKISDLLSIVNQHFSTDMSIQNLVRLSDLVKRVDKSKIINKVIDNSSTGVLNSAVMNGADVLVPKAGTSNYTDIQNIAENIFTSNAVSSENAQVEIQNGGATSKSVTNLISTLKSSGITILKTSTSATTYQTSQIIDYTNNNKPNTIQFLKTKISGATVSVQPLPTGSKTDIVIILGSNFQE
jgi:LCP family protein required for cell wall assembly